MAAITAEEHAERAKEYRRAVEPHLGGEKVEAAAIFERRYFRLGDDFGLSYLVQWAYHRRKEGIRALPATFLLAVTRDSVYAFSYRMKESEFEVKKQLARFNREDISFSGKGSRWTDPRLQEAKDERMQRIPLDGAINDKRDPW